jgi:hypothetical protein
MDLIKKRTNPKTVKFDPAETFAEGEFVYLTQQYYTDTKATMLEVPKYGWKIKGVIDGIATIEYQRPNLKLLMSLMLKTKYLTKEL